DGTLTAGKVVLVDFEHPENNDWLAVRQFTVINGRNTRRPDVVVFVNGLPLAVIELKAPGNENATLVGAFNQLQTYKQQIPQLFHTNALLVTSDGSLPGWGRCRPTWSGSCRGVPRTARRSRPRGHRNCRR